MARLREQPQDAVEDAVLALPDESLMSFHWQEWDRPGEPLPDSVARFGDRLQHSDPAEVAWFRRVLAGRERWFAARAEWSRVHGVDIDEVRPAPSGRARRRGAPA